MSNSDFRRIETLIPYKAPEFSPRQRRLGSLNPDSSIWSSSAKLGRYLLSGAEAADVEAIALAAASSLLDCDLVPAEPDSRELRVLSGRVTGPLSTLHDPDGEFVFVAHDKASAYVLGHCAWKRGFRTIGMTITEAVGLSELVSNAGGHDALRGHAKADATASFLTQAARHHEQLERWDSLGLVEWAEPAPEGATALERRTRPFATARPTPTSTRWLFESDRISYLGTDDEVAAAAEEAGRKAADRVRDDLLCALGHDKHTDLRLITSILRSSAARLWEDEGERIQNREWAADQLREAHTARVFEDKKNREAAHMAAAARGFIGREFSRTEIDDRVDLAEFADLEAELAARVECGEIPRIDRAAHDLRFRLLGRHKAWGLYFPRQPMIKTPCIAVDCRHPGSLLHEFAHAYDYEHGQLSATDPRFREEILRPFAREFRTLVKDEELPISPKKVGYYTTPTEVFARSWEVYAAANGFGGSFVEPDRYATDPAYTGLMDLGEAVHEYFDGFARPSAAPALPSPEPAREEWECDLVETVTEDVHPSWDEVWDNLSTDEQMNIFDYMEER